MRHNVLAVWAKKELGVRNRDGRKPRVRRVRKEPQMQSLPVKDKAISPYAVSRESILIWQGERGGWQLRRKKARKVYARQRDSRYQRGKQEVCGRTKTLLFLKGPALSALLGTSRLTQTVQTFTTTSQTIPGTPAGSSAVAFGKTAGDEWAGQLSYQG